MKRGWTALACQPRASLMPFKHWSSSIPSSLQMRSVGFSDYLRYLVPLRSTPLVGLGEIEKILCASSHRLTLKLRFPTLLLLVCPPRRCEGTQPGRQSTPATQCQRRAHSRGRSWHRAVRMN